MVKPTLWQAVLNKPTRTYLDLHQPISFPSPAQIPSYPSRHSTVSSASASSLALSSYVTAHSDTSNSQQVSHPQRRVSERPSLPSLSQRSSSSLRSARVTAEEQANNRSIPTSTRRNPSQSTNSASLRFLASTSDPTSTTNTHHLPSVAPERKPTLRHPPPPHNPPPPASKRPASGSSSPILAPSPVLAPPSCSPALDNPQEAADITDSDSDEAEDVFYTPFSSPPGSPEPKPLPPTPNASSDVTSTTEGMSLVEAVKISVSTVPKPGIQVQPLAPSPLATTTPPTVRMSTVSMCTSTSSLPSVVTAPLSEDGTFTDFSWRSSSAWSETSHSGSSNQPSKHDSPQKRSPKMSVSESRKGEMRKSLDELTADWAKQVRWLIPPEEMAKQAQSRKSHPRPRSVSSSSSRRTDSSGTSSTNPPPVPRRRPRVRSPEPSSTADRMSALLEVDETGERGDVNRVIGSAHSAPQSRGVPQKSAMRRTRTHSASASRSRQSLAISDSSYKTATSRTVVIPSPLPVSDGTSTASTGFTSLTLPRAAYVPQPVKYTDKVDLTLSGLAQTTMSTISITKHAADLLVNNRARRLSISMPFFLGNKSKTDTPIRLLSDEPSSLSFTSATSPPSKIHSHQVLVQVWAVAIDGMDQFVVHEKSQKPDGNGFIPGRSFVGRAVECGWEVSNISKGDWVFGLLDVPKGGALAEFITVDRRRLHTAPIPSPRLPIEHMAMLPLLAVPARRAIKTITAFPKDLDALILQANHGTGLLIIEELVSRGAKVVCQVEREKDATWVRSAGAAKVIVAEPLAAIEDLADSSVDVVVDMVGGKDIWDASRRILRPSGSQFTTIVGDSQTTVPTTNALAKANMRSLRRAFAKKDRKIIGYEWVSLAADVDHEGEDVRDSLSVISKMASEGSMSFTSLAVQTLPFERTPELFKPLDPAALPPVSSFEMAVIRIIG